MSGGGKGRTRPSEGRQTTGRRSDPKTQGAKSRTGDRAPERDEVPGEITIFLSYSRADDRIYKMVRPFKELLGHLIYAKSGLKVKSFLDQDDIRWGQIWRDRLEAEILGASVFIPLLSASYLDSDNCRMEFNKFHAKATALGVSELLLPVLILEAPAIFHEEAEDDIVQVSASTQWEVIEEAVLSDAGSSAWKKTMARLADRFVDAYRAAEDTLADLGDSEVGAEGSFGDAGDDDDEDSPGISEIYSELEELLPEMTQASQDLTPALTGLGDAARAAGKLPDKPTARQVQAWSLSSAKAFEVPAGQILEAGERMFAAVKRADVAVSRLRAITVDLSRGSGSVSTGYNEMIAEMGGLDVVAEQLEGLLDKMRPAEHFSAALRKALRPARLGVKRVRDSLNLLRSWEPVSA
ncbi:toll/interleukin-1 receptor domain-containing protein [Pseudoclavibacter sp. RFBA6]|uniref:toll/interleukin-1 receptor domain-containing protein n=1 Tax=Pseudoclavibacter sp. RFBA6 TaxID=2080573 RepID=UPI0015E2116F|nr:toll/interleukin-1 receptor domain-containing protein [Pseudoclavibacter sp. RFBA6]